MGHFLDHFEHFLTKWILFRQKRAKIKKQKWSDSLLLQDLAVGKIISSILWCFEKDYCKILKITQSGSFFGPLWMKKIYFVSRILKKIVF